MQSNTSEDLYNIWGNLYSLVAVGNNDTILHYDVVEWTKRTSGTLKSLRHIWGDSRVMYVIGDMGTILKSEE